MSAIKAIKYRDGPRALNLVVGKEIHQILNYAKKMRIMINEPEVRLLFDHELEAYVRKKIQLEFIDSYVHLCDWLGIEIVSLQWKEEKDEST